ncbi:pentapeptide repeat-containing protein [Amycolatopsis sp. cmx-4-61]|uniref:pentapeptide repeat-containing protein n=1 Tax=Amycolatopsis sp. cmx-4-61 TaxID=2790937 RepID=UPI00397DC7C0
MTDDATPSSPATAVPAPPPLAAPVRVVRLRELSPKTMWWTAAVIAALTAGAVVVLWWPATAGLNGAALVTVRLDALKIGLSIGVGSGGVVALYLAWRRQHSTEADLDNRERALAHQQEVAAATIAHQDRVARATEHDAAERRLTELYLKAVEQLGSAQAAVRHGGLYALERVAQDNPSQRQTVVDVICAYLRNPYALLPDTGGPRPLGMRRPLVRSATVCRTLTPPLGAARAREDQHQEREVRLTAQRVLHRHLQPGDDPDQPRHTFWADIDLDLTGATLINFAFTGCRVGTGAFREATFSDIASFDRTTFTGDALFVGATFTSAAWFDKTTFIRAAAFVEATFGGDALFGRATFNGPALFAAATFTREVRFVEATFTEVASFEEATFTGAASFVEATFAGDARFERATFTRAWFSGATFARDAQFSGTTSTRDVRFGQATIACAVFVRATFAGAALFNETIFAGGARFDGTAFTHVSFDRAAFKRDAFFTGTTRLGRAFNPVKDEV